MNVILLKRISKEASTSLNCISRSFSTGWVSVMRFCASLTHGNTAGAKAEAVRKRLREGGLRGPVITLLNYFLLTAHFFDSRLKERNSSLFTNSKLHNMGLVSG